jgi:hypothetical protein
MTQVIPPQHFHVSYHMHGGPQGRPAVWTLGVLYVGTNSAVDFPTLGLGWRSTIKNSTNGLWVLDEIIVSDAVGAVKTLTMGDAGGVAHVASVASESFLVHKYTGLGGRKNRGRIFLPGLSDQDRDPYGVLIGSKVTELQNNLTDFYGLLQSSNLQPRLLHSDATPPTNILQFQLDGKIATQRRRLRK